MHVSSTLMTCSLGSNGSTKFLESMLSLTPLYKNGVNPISAPPHAQPGSPSAQPQRHGTHRSSLPHDLIRLPVLTIVDYLHIPWNSCGPLLLKRRTEF
jgi:hypothetical protein